MENNKYLEELSRVLRKHDIKCGPVENGRLIIRMDGQPVGRIEHGGTRCVAPGDLRTEEASEAFQKEVPFAEMVEFSEGTPYFVNGEEALKKFNSIGSYNNVL